MAGNAAEWTSDEAKAPDGAPARVVRGGSAKSGRSGITAESFHMVDETNADAAMLIGFDSPAAGRILALVAALFMAKRVLLLPRMERHRAGREVGDETATRAFRRLHGFSMVLNLVAGAAVLAAFLLAV